ncbi:MFS transporter [Bacillus thuringiensis]|uniref:MFS transporter n=1 Tax=Bacillus thuringiensis TaxID=1428 RepID=UPI0005CEE678|nr:MFS transporter [Bacillus thuringiensis]
MIRKHANQKFYYGWVIVLISAMGLFFSGPGQTYSNSQFIDEYIHNFGWSRSEISGVYSAATLIAGLAMMFIGRFIDRFGQRTMMIIIGALLGISCFYNSIVSNIGMLAVGFFLVRLLGQGSMSLIPNTLVAQWFIKKRGRSFSLMTLGSFASAMVFPIVNTWLIHTWNWQFAWRFWGMLLFIVFIPIVFLSVRNKPEDIGLKPDGFETIKQQNVEQNIKTTLVETEEDWSLKEAMHTKTFWAILICVGIPATVNTGITFHIISIFGSNNLSPEVAAMVLSLMAIIGIPMSFISGFITEKVKTNYLLVLVFIIEFILLLLLMKTTSLSTAILFGILWGIANGLERIGLTVIWPDYFGRKYIGSINGVGMTVGVLGSAFGPLPFGIGFDIFHSYTPVLLMTLVLPLIGIACSIIAKKPIKSKLIVQTS